MKKILIITLMCVFSFSYAQENRKKQASPDERAQQKIDRLDAELQFSEIQKKDLKSFFVKQMEANEELRSQRIEARKEVRSEAKIQRAERGEMRSKREARRAVMQENIGERREQTEAYMKEVLTEEQFEKWQKIKEDRSQVGKERRGERGGDQMMERKRKVEGESRGRSSQGGSSGRR